MIRKLILLLLLVIPACLSAQAPQLFSTGQGLVSTRIEQIAFDRDNYLWITTNQGLSRFDGQTFTTYTREKGNPHALQESYVTAVFESKSGQQWIGAADGLYYLCRTENSLTHFILDSTQVNISVSQIVAHPFMPDHILIGTYGFGIFIFDTQHKRVNQAETTHLRMALKRWNCQHILTDSHNRLWVASPTNLQCIDLEKMEDIPLDGEAANGRDLVVQNILEDRRHDRIYFATLNEGLLYCDLGIIRLARFDHPDLNCRNLTALALSPGGDVMVGTESNGLWRIHLGQVSRVVVEDCPTDLDHSKIHCITYDAQWNLWLGLYQKGVLVIPNQHRLFTCRPIRPQNGIYNLGCVSSFASMSDGSRLYGIDGEGLIREKRDGTVQHFCTGNGAMQTNAVISVVSLPGNQAYVGTYKHGLYHFDGHSLRRDPQLALLDKQSIMTMAHDSLTQTLYIGTNGDGIYAYQTNTHLLSRVSGEWNLLWIVSLSIDRRHRLWASTEGSIVCFDPQNESRLQPSFHQPVRAYGYAEDQNGTMWFATDHGLLTYGASSDNLEQVRVDDEVLNEEVFSILRGRDGRLWLPTSHDIVCYDPRHHTISRYYDPEIAAVGSYSLRAAITWPDGRFTFGADNGVLEFEPEAVLAYRRPLRPIQFTRLWINNVPTDYDPNLPADKNVLDHALWKATSLHLPASANSFSISFAVQEYCNPLGIRYSYCLEGYDDAWHDVLGQDLTASYTALLWGDYQLHVKASLMSGNGEVQTAEKILNITIDAPWWASWWAVILYLMVLAAIGYGIYYYYKIRAAQRRLIRHAAQARQIKEAKLRMFTSVSHEIKTPLTLIISPLRRLMQRNNDNATQSIYEMMYRSSLRILMLVIQQMDIRRIDNGQLRLHVAEQSLREFLEDIMQYFTDSANSREVDFRLIMPAERPDIRLWFDRYQLDKVFFNLLSNAFRHVNESGHVLIKVIPDFRQQMVRIEVFNSGSRINADASSQLFERFGADGKDRLGLSLSNDLTEMHHGKLSARNESEGVTFCVSLPLGEMAYSEEEKKPSERSEVSEQEQLELESRALREEGREEGSEEKELIELLSEELHEKQVLRERRAKLKFNFSDKQLSSADERLLNRVSDCITQNLSDQDFSVDELASQVGLSRVHLNRKLKELIDTSPSALIRNTRLKQAAFLLTHNNVTVAEVAYSVGYSSPAYFTSNFSSYFNMSPKEFVNAFVDKGDSPELLKLLE